MPRHATVLAFVATVCLCLTIALSQEPEKRAAPRTLPGVQAGGAVLLPNQWSIKPAGKQVLVGDFPVNMVLHPSGEWLAILHSGYGDHEVAILNVKRQKVASRVILDQSFYGLCFAPDGKKLYASGGEFEVVHSFDFANGYLSGRKDISIVKKEEKFVVGGLTTDAEGKTLFAAGPWGDAVAIVPLDAPETKRLIAFEKGSYPYGVLFDNKKQRLFVSLWADASVAVIDMEMKEVVAKKWVTERHPTEMALSPDGKTLYVACANSTKVSVLDAATGAAQETLASSLYPTAPNGSTPNSLSLTPDGQLLFVANADNNNVCIFNVGEKKNAKPLGFIPVGWYPTSVRYHAAEKKLIVANGKGASSFANPQGPNPLLSGPASTRQYIGSLFRGTLSIIDMPTPDQMVKHSEQAYKNSPLREDLGPILERPDGNPIPKKIGEPSPIKHCIYIIKENRTYDQVLGDMKEGNGDPNLVLFGEKITPNHHKLAREFVLLDNFYVEGEVSADGHEWSMGAYCTDFVEKVWPLNYRGSPLKKLAQYPSEGEKDPIARPAGGYIWDRCAEAGVSYRSYGEWIATSKSPDLPGKARVKALEGHFDPMYRGYDLDYPDVKRAERFIEELKGFERTGNMPQFIVMRLPNNHTFGTRVGKPTPTAMVAENDLAFGMVIEAISKSKFWKETAVFVVEDDAQNGPDHVDAHRTIAFVVSPYTKRGYVDSSMYSTSSMLRSMELILGLKPMSQFDAAARPMYASFQPQPDLRPYLHVVPQVDMTEKNQPTAWGADLSEKFDLSREDAADDFLFNEVIWRSVKGPKSPMPAPVRAAFVFPHLKKDKDD